MSENRTECLQFEDLLLEGGPEADLGIWQPHLETCAGCREQLIAHQMLAATFADEAVPELSASFCSRASLTMPPISLPLWRIRL
jgi:hypothetical protein